MRLTLDVELSESDLSNAPGIQQALEALSPNGKVTTRMVTDKDALATRIQEAISNGQYDAIRRELKERLSQNLFAEDCIEVLCSAALFSTQRVEKGESVEPFIAVVACLPDQAKDRARQGIVQRAMTFLSNPRRADSSRTPILPYAETLAALTAADVLNMRTVIFTVAKMIRLESTRTAGMTCLGKLVEVAHEGFRKCDQQELGVVRVAVECAQQDDAFLYDVEYIMEALGWSESKSALTMVRNGPYHEHPILSLAYSGDHGTGMRELVVTSSVDGNIGTWDAAGGLTESIILSRHYAASLDIANRGNSLIVGAVSRHGNTPPAVIIYAANCTPREHRWTESTAVEPKDARFITSVRALRFPNSLRYGVAVSLTASSGSLEAHSLQLYDNVQLVREYRGHSDIITALYAPTDRENLLVSGSRDRSVLIYDVRSAQSVCSPINRVNTVTSISMCDNYIFTGDIGRRVVVEDFRMLTQPLVREMDSAVLSLSVNSSMKCAVSTLTGIHVVDLSNSTQAPTSSRVEGGKMAHNYNAVSWNQNGRVLYAGGDGRTLDVFQTLED